MRSRPQTSLRMRYLAECEVLKHRYGDLEQIRTELGLSRRAMAELLLVDPSAWTRWTQRADSVPPLLWRALSWYLELERQRPEWKEWREFLVAQSRGRTPTRVQADPDLALTLRDLQSEISTLKLENQRLEQEHVRSEAVSAGWKLILVLNSLAWLVFVLWRWLA